ncbi:MAG: Phenylalanine--tRNA ligase beta subunit [Microgenomates group bacterium Gr01-1014_7]|nr:MAG: Phenylalanine--tRNA ligase beta subunit [Microgenomates group bacterium Gr01-1014_7]
MKVSLNWLKEFVDYSLSPKELADQLSLISIGIKQLTPEYLELDLTYNRGDLLSLRGVAREVAAITGSELRFKDENFPAFKLPQTPVEIENSQLCPVYCVAKIENLKVEDSNDTWVKKLRDCGIRAINNIADVTNLIMLEYGQPMHAFDAGKVKGVIKVITAKEKEEIKTLDGKTRILNGEDLVIADEEKAIGIAGVMGGKDSEVSDSTNTILLEAAIFDPVTNRKTAKRHGLPSEASKRFQHGLTKTNLLQALSSAIKMYEGLGGKLTAITLTGNLEDKPKTVELTREKINSLIGIEIPVQQVESSLQSLGFNLKRKGANPNHLEGGLAWHVFSPYWRLDIDIEEDLVEEVARMYGYEKIPARPLEGWLPEKLNQSLQDKIYQLKLALKNAGLTEVQTYSFYSTKVMNDLRLKINALIKIANPISSETQYLRDQIWLNLIEVVARNIKKGHKDIAIFEIGKVYGQEEKYHLGIALMNGTDNPLAELAIISDGVKLPHPRGVSRGVSNKEVLHPIRQMENMAEVHPRILNKFGIENRVAILEIEI